jgi:Uncharacterized protein involved in cytokinesis, contains TGc (transglutaminase/protease-like) domain
MNRKKLTAMLLILFMLAAMLPIPASAEEVAGGAGEVPDEYSADIVTANGTVIRTGIAVAEPEPEPESEPEPEPEYWAEPEPAAMETRVAEAVTVYASGPAVAESAPEAEPDAGAAQLMPVVFRSDETNDFSGLTVWDADGTVMQPFTDPETGETQHENYLLFPGTYSYSYRDPAGRFADRVGDFSVSQSGLQFVTLALPSVAVEMCFSSTAVNPCYAGVIPEESIPIPSTSPEESLAELLEEVEELSPSQGRREMTAVYAAEGPLLTVGDAKAGIGSPVIYDNAEAAGAALKRSLIQRQKEINIRIKCGIKPTKETWQQICWMIYDIAIRHSGMPTEGDYLRYEYGGANCNGSAAGSGTEDEYYYSFIYSPLYFTSLAQETELNTRVTEILNELMLVGKSDEQKISAVYRYLCDHVSYDDSRDTLIFTAYSALVNGRAACQGVAVAFYRLCLELGLDARIVTSKSLGHAWNIVRADGKHYYAVDATWEPGNSPGTWEFYLKGRTSWQKEHTLGDEFLSGSFSDYDFPDEDYGALSGAVIHSVSLVFDGMLRIKYYFALPGSLTEDQKACIRFSRDGETILSVPLAEGRQEGECRYYYCGVSADKIAVPIQARILDGDGNPVPICSRGGTSYPNGFFFSPMEYARQMKSSASTGSMRALAQALEDYGIAAENYFNKKSDALRDEVSAVSAADLAAWETRTDGAKPAGLVNAAISVLFEADNSLRLYLQFDGGKSAEDYRYEVDGRPAELRKRSDGVGFLTVENIAADALDTAHRFVISDGTDSYSVTASVLSYARTAIERGDSGIANLGRALFLYNRAAENYFGS